MRCSHRPIALPQIGDSPKRSCRRRSWRSGTARKHSIRQSGRSRPGCIRSRAIARSTDFARPAGARTLVPLSSAASSGSAYRRQPGARCRRARTRARKRHDRRRVGAGTLAGHGSRAARAARSPAGGAGRDAGGRTGGDRPGLWRGPDADRDRRSTRLAARDGQDADPAGARCACARSWAAGSAPNSPDTWPGPPWPGRIADASGEAWITTRYSNSSSWRPWSPMG